MALSSNDEVLLGILKEKGHILPFLDAVFGFLYRCTDFYRIQNYPSDKLGFPSGVAEMYVMKMLKKWEMQAREDDEYYKKKRISHVEDVPPAIQEVVLPSEEDSTSQQADSQKKTVSEDAFIAVANLFLCLGSRSTTKQKSAPSSGDHYNGAILDNYRWSQTVIDLDVQVPVPEHVLKARDVRVDVTATTMSVAVKEEGGSAWTTLMSGKLCWRTNKDESIWSLEAGKHVQVHLEKSQERWWDSLLVSEPKIDLSKIDATRSMDDLAQDEQMKIQELMWNQERKQQGLPTSDQLAAESILKEAWNKEGSPFLGTEYDPTLINFGNECSQLPGNYGDHA
ncbi:hypothetical protein ANN_04924 [Periplaneta americana]|uniref:CS domain-containing protein n=1 Tax=Periplaneta americana TaxID=6978 RepID=A0ABQ8TAY3_PERAM|nr:hypothetical protein ANN_04924 [Periplaneta americana]